MKESSHQIDLKYKKNILTFVKSLTVLTVVLDFIQHIISLAFVSDDQSKFYQRQ